MDSKSYILITDSSCDLPAEYYEEHNIPFGKISFTIDGETYPDDAGRSMSYEEFYARLSGGSMPTTSMVNITDFVQIFEPFLKEGKDILYSAFTSGLSGSCGAGQAAAQELKVKYPNRTIRVVDSLCASLGHGLLVHYALKRYNQGATLDELGDWLEDNKLKMNHIVTVEDLMHLHRGGRISRTSAVLGSLMSIKPMIYVNDAGELKTTDKVRGRQRSLQHLLDYAEHQTEGDDLGDIAICHSHCYEDAKYVEGLLRERYKVGECIINHIGAVIGSHTGQGTVAIFFFGKQRDAWREYIKV